MHSSAARSSSYFSESTVKRGLMQLNMPRCMNSSLHAATTNPGKTEQPPETCMTLHIWWTGPNKTVRSDPHCWKWRLPGSLLRGRDVSKNVFYEHNKKMQCMKAAQRQIFPDFYGKDRCSACFFSVFFIPLWNSFAVKQHTLGRMVNRSMPSAARCSFKRPIVTHLPILGGGTASFCFSCQVVMCRLYCTATWQVACDERFSFLLERQKKKESGKHVPSSSSSSLLCSDCQRADVLSGMFDPGGVLLCEWWFWMSLKQKMVQLNSL